MFRKSFLTISLLLVIGAGSFDLHAGNAYLGWRFFSKFNESREGKVQREAEEKREAEERAAAEEKRIAEEKREAEERAAAEEKRIAEEKREAEENARAFEQFCKDTGNFFSAVGHGIVWYLPNRLSDIVDCFTVEAGIGEIGFNLYLTRYATFGAGVGHSYMTGWSVNDQNGLYCEQSWYANFLQLCKGDTSRRTICGDYVQFYRYSNGAVDISQMISEKAEDPFAIGVKAACYVGFKFQFHPVELADCLAGFLFIDFRGDDE